MAEISFNVQNFTVMQVRLEPTEIFGSGSLSNPSLMFRFRLQLQPVPVQRQQGPQQNGHYTLIRLGGKLIMHTNEEVLSFEAPPMAEESSQQSFYRQFDLPMPISVSQLKRIEELRDGKDPSFRVELNGLVAIPDGRFERLQNGSLDLKVPRSHWIDHVVNTLNISDLRLLEVRFPASDKKDVQVAKDRLLRAEHFYKTGDYPQVLTALRSSFDAIAECYSAKSADRNLFEKMLVNSHPEMRAKLRDAFDYLYRMLHVGPHEPTPKPETPVPVSRHDARFALLTAHAVFEYFSSEGWPGI